MLNCWEWRLLSVFPELRRDFALSPALATLSTISPSLYFDFGWATMPRTLDWSWQWWGRGGSTPSTWSPGTIRIRRHKTILKKDSPAQKYVSSSGWRKEARPLSCLQPTASIDLKSKKVFPFKEFTHTPLLFPLQEIDLPRCTDRHN